MRCCDCRTIWRPRHRWLFSFRQNKHFFQFAYVSLGRGYAVGPAFSSEPRTGAAVASEKPHAIAVRATRTFRCRRSAWLWDFFGVCSFPLESGACCVCLLLLLCVLKEIYSHSFDSLFPRFPPQQFSGDTLDQEESSRLLGNLIGSSHQVRATLMLCCASLVHGLISFVVLSPIQGDLPLLCLLFTI